MATRFYLPSTGTAGASPAVCTSWDFSVSAFIRRATVTTKISSAFATISLDGNTDSNDTDYCYVQYVSAPIAAQTISAQTVDWVVSLFEENARANQYLAMCIRVVSGDGSTVRGTVVALQRDGTELGTSQASRYDSATSTQVVASEGDRIVIEIGTGGNPEVGAGGDSHDADVRIGDNSATDFGESGGETSDYCGWVEFANTITFQAEAITVNLSCASITASGPQLDVQPGAVSIGLGCAAITATGPQASVSLGGAEPITINLACAGITATGPGLDVQPGAVSIGLDCAGIAAAGPGLDVQPGAVSIGLDCAAITASGPQITISAPAAGAITVNLACAIVTAAGPQLDVQPGAVSIGLVCAAIAAAAPGLDVQPGAVSIGLDCAGIAAMGPGLDVQPGAVSIGLVCAAIAATGLQLDVQPGAMSVGLDCAVVTASGLDVSISNDSRRPGTIVAGSRSSTTVAGSTKGNVVGGTGKKYGVG